MQKKSEPLSIERVITGLEDDYSFAVESINSLRIELGTLKNKIQVVLKKEIEDTNVMHQDDAYPERECFSELGRRILSGNHYVDIANELNKISKDIEHIYSHIDL